MLIVEGRLFPELHRGSLLGLDQGQARHDPIEDGLVTDFRRELAAERREHGFLFGHGLPQRHSWLLQLVPAAKRVGPLIIDEEAGRPHATDGYAREWRAVADETGIPKHVWTMDARARAITEADDAGADLDEIRSGAAHSQTSTTARYVRGSIGKSRNVAKLRAAHRTAKNAP